MGRFSRGFNPQSEVVHLAGFDLGLKGGVADIRMGVGQNKNGQGANRFQDHPGCVQQPSTGFDAHPQPRFPMDGRHRYFHRFDTFRNRAAWGSFPSTSDGGLQGIPEVPDQKTDPLPGPAVPLLEDGQGLDRLNPGTVGYRDGMDRRGRFQSDPVIQQPTPGDRGDPDDIVAGLKPAGLKGDFKLIGMALLGAGPLMDGSPAPGGRMVSYPQPLISTRSLGGKTLTRSSNLNLSLQDPAAFGSLTPNQMEKAHGAVFPRNRLRDRDGHKASRSGCRTGHDKKPVFLISPESLGASANSRLS